MSGLSGYQHIDALWAEIELGRKAEHAREEELERSLGMRSAVVTYRFSLLGFGSNLNSVWIHNPGIALIVVHLLQQASIDSIEPCDLLVLRVDEL